MTSIQQERKEFLQNHRATHLVNHYETCSCGYLLSGLDALSIHQEAQWAKYFMAGYKESTDVLYERKNGLYEVAKETKGETK